MPGSKRPKDRWVVQPNSAKETKTRMDQGESPPDQLLEAVANPAVARGT